MTTYKKFLIHSNMRCYLDEGGKLIPMFPLTDFKSIEEVHKRVDQYWNEFQEFESRRQINYAKSLSILTDDTDRSDEARENEAQDFEDKVNEYWENELNQD